MKRKWIKSIMAASCLLPAAANAQDIKQEVKKAFQISGTMGVTYEGYGLSRNPRR